MPAFPAIADLLFDDPAADAATARAEARARLRDRGRACPWVEDVVRHHDAIEQALAAAIDAGRPATQAQALRRLTTLCTGHALAEEAVLYPAMALGTQRMHALAAYGEEARIKIALGAAAAQAPLSEPMAAALGLVQSLLLRHQFEEERHWFASLCREGDADLHRRLSSRYRDEADRYLGAETVPS